MKYITLLCFIIIPLNVCYAENGVDTHLLDTLLGDVINDQKFIEKLKNTTNVIQTIESIQSCQQDLGTNEATYNVMAFTVLNSIKREMETRAEKLDEKLEEMAFFAWSYPVWKERKKLMKYIENLKAEIKITNEKIIEEGRMPIDLINCIGRHKPALEAEENL